MAIDSAVKRASVASMSSLFVGPSVIPSGSITLADRQQIGYGYPGITVLSFVPGTVDNIEFSSKQRSIEFSTKQRSIEFTT